MKHTNPTAAQSLVELLLAIALTSVILPGLLTGFVTSREGRAQQNQRQDATALMREAMEAVRSVRNRGWINVSTNGTYHPAVSSSQWTLSAGSESVNGFTRQIVIADAQRNGSGTIVTSGGTVDPSTKKVTITVSWTQPYSSSTQSDFYLTRYLDNMTWTQTLKSEFDGGTFDNTMSTNTAGGEVTIANNNKAKWCEPAFASTTIDLPDGPPVAVAATASSSIAVPNDVFVATSPVATSSVKLAYVNVSANTDPPISTLRGTFTLDSSKYSNASYVPTGIGLNNSFETNDVKYYKSSGNKTYALMTTDLPDKEVIAILVNDNDSSNDNTTSGEYADPVNKIYKYWTFFNTRRYQGVATQDQSPYGYGASSLAVLNNKGYVASGGYLYVFDLSNIDSKSTSSGLDMVGCRIELDGYDCRPGSPATMTKYSSGQSGATYGDNGSPSHNDCSDGGNIEYNATDHLYPIQVGSSTYVYVAVGGGTNPELDIVNVTSIPSGSTSPTISNNSCGRITGGNSGWKRGGSLDFNTAGGTEEAANSVYVRSDGARAYMTSNGGSASKQFYVLDTTNKTAPKFLSGTSTPTSGFYNGNTTANGQLYPRRSLTVLNGQRAVLVGKDGISDSNNATEYQVLNLSNEASPTYCGSVDYDQGFNDLTSVSEADGDNYVYMVANTTTNELKIIQGGPDGMYFESGQFTSSAFDAGYTTAFNRIDISSVVPANTSLLYQVALANPGNGICSSASYDFVGPLGTSSDYYTATGGALFIGTTGNYSNPGRCMKYRGYFSTTDYNATPQLLDTTVNYSP